MRSSFSVPLGIADVFLVSGFIGTVVVPVCSSNRGLSFIVCGININQISKGKFAQVHLVSFSSICADYFHVRME